MTASIDFSPAISAFLLQEEEAPLPGSLPKIISAILSSSSYYADHLQIDNAAYFFFFLAAYVTCCFAVIFVQCARISVLSLQVDYKFFEAGSRIFSILPAQYLP